VRGRTYYRLKHVWQRGRIAASSVRPAPQWSGLRILGYHSVSATPDELALPPRAFEAHMRTLAASPLVPVRLGADLPDLAPSGRYVAVTFDDGYRDLLDVAPLLERLRIPATVFVCSGVLDGEAAFAWYRVQPPLLTWDDLREIVAHGWIRVGAHTRTHPVLPLLDDATAFDEIAGSKSDLEAQLQIPIETFCYPGGHFSDRDVDAVARSGFRYACTTEPGTNGPGADPLRLRRTMVGRRDTELDFRAKIAGRLDRPSGLRSLFRRRLVARPDGTSASSRRAEQ
jgi:peptidoglycan/xylan/chitin deacetylase (PgdA/CDA1 family)